MLVFMRDYDSRIYRAHGNGSDAVHILEQEVSEMGFTLGVSETENGVLNNDLVLCREVSL